METNQNKWQNLKGEIFHQPIIQLVEDAIVREQMNGHRIKICVGSDSQVYGNIIHYATVIVFVRERKGAFMFIRKEKEYRKIGIKERS